jgi:HK97 family phage prohead protease
MLILKTVLSSKGEAQGMARIAAGDVDKTSDWSFSADDGNKLLGSGDDDWASHAKWFLGTEPDADPSSKAYYKYPFGKDGKVFRSGLIAIRSRAAQQSETAIFDAAGRMIDKIDGNKNYSGVKALAMKQRAWSKFSMKAVTETDTHYELAGIATTPTPDRMQDIVEPMGGEYELPIPLLWQHDSDEPVGEVFYAQPDAKGIPVQFRIPKLVIPGTLKDRLDLAMQSITLNLVRGLSIGFAPVEYSYIEDTGGYRFIKWLWLELSAVTIPANAEASIAVIKSFDRGTSAVVRLSAESLAKRLHDPPTTRLRLQEWCDTSSETVDEIIAQRERVFK